jgi:hypothetical protein
VQLLDDDLHRRPHEVEIGADRWLRILRRCHVAIGALLGHKETATTARYAHLSDDPLRSAVNVIGSKIADALDADAV